MLENKLGIKNVNDMINIEYYLFNIKYHIINSNYNFNEEEIFDIKYLEKIHIFLFSDIYPQEICTIRKAISEENLNYIKEKIQELKISVECLDYKLIRKNIYDIWERQMFRDGNTRTLLCFLKILKEKYDLDINYDFKKDIYKDSFIRELVDSIGNNQNIKNR